MEGSRGEFSVSVFIVKWSVSSVNTESPAEVNLLVVIFVSFIFVCPFPFSYILNWTNKTTLFHSFVAVASV